MLLSRGQHALARAAAAAGSRLLPAMASMLQRRLLSSGSAPRMSLAAVEKLFREMEGRWGCELWL